MPTTASQILARFPNLVRLVSGDPAATATKPCPQDHPEKGGIAYVSDEKFLTILTGAPLAILVAHEKLVPKLTEAKHGFTLLASKNPYLAMALINREYFSLPFVGQAFDGKDIHPTAVLDKSVKVGKGVRIGPYAVIHQNVTIGDGTFIGPHSVVEANTKIGQNCMIHPMVYIGHTCTLGDRVEIKPQSMVGGDGFGYAHDEKGNHYRIPHYGPVILEDDVHLGSNVCIDRGTYEPAIVGAGTKIDNHAHLGHNVRMGKNCLATAGFLTAGSAVIGDNCVFGGRSAVNGHIKLTSNVTIGPMSGVLSSIDEPGVYAGYPVIPMKESLKVQMSLASLPRIRRSVAKILKHLGLENE